MERRWREEERRGEEDRGGGHTEHAEIDAALMKSIGSEVDPQTIDITA